MGGEIAQEMMLARRLLSFAQFAVVVMLGVKDCCLLLLLLQVIGSELALLSCPQTLHASQGVRERTKAERKKTRKYQFSK